jgi:hypothetical protein
MARDGLTSSSPMNGGLLQSVNQSAPGDQSYTICSITGSWLDQFRFAEQAAVAQSAVSARTNAIDDPQRGQQ